MIFQVQNMMMTDRLREIVRSHDADFPYAALESDLSLFSGRCSPWHWHDQFEFAVVVNGRMELQTQLFRAVLEPGDAYFVNANVLHLCRAADDSSLVRLHVHQFERSLVAAGGLVSRRYVAPIENAATFQARVFSGAAEEEQALIQALSIAFSAAREDKPGWEMAVAGCLTDAWRRLYCLCAGSLQGTGVDGREDIMRTKTMLSFIHENYARDISVEEIARTAGICERECFRCFARVLDTTPKAYLAKYRISVAARLLSETNDSITEIAYRCGFANSSYFGKVFRRMLGRTPRDFRRG